MKDLCLTNPEIIALVLVEHRRQIEKWGIQEHEVSWWLTFTGEEYGEMCDAAAEHAFRGGPASDVVKEAIQTATLALKIAEAYLELAKKNGEDLVVKY